MLVDLIKPDSQTAVSGLLSLFNFVTTLQVLIGFGMTTAVFSSLRRPRRASVAAGWQRCFSTREALCAFLRYDMIRVRSTYAYVFNVTTINVFCAACWCPFSRVQQLYSSTITSSSATWLSAFFPGGFLPEPQHEASSLLSLLSPLSSAPVAEIVLQLATICYLEILFPTAILIFPDRQQYQ